MDLPHIRAEGNGPPVLLIHGLGASATLVRMYLRLIWGDPTAIREEHVRGYLEAMGAANFYPSMVEAVRLLGGYRLPLEALRQASHPCVLLWGERDRLVPAEEGHRL